MILIAHVIFDLFLTSFEFHHDLPVSLFDSLTIISLACATILKRFLPFLFGLHELIKLKFIKLAHGNCSIVRFLTSTFNVFLKLLHLCCPEADKLFIIRYVSASQ